MFSTKFLLALNILSVAVAGVAAAPLTKRAVAFFDPVAGGGSWLDNAGSGGEPLNVISRCVWNILEQTPDIFTRSSSLD